MAPETCIEEGCDQPVHVSETGWRYQRCLDHNRAFRADQHQRTQARKALGVSAFGKSPTLCVAKDCNEKRRPDSEWCTAHHEQFIARSQSAPAPRDVLPKYLQPKDIAMTPINQLCSIVDCDEPHAPNSHLCAKHRAELDRVDQIRKHHMVNGNGKPAAPAVATCCEPGCDQPVLVTPAGRTFKRCKRHHGARVMAGKQRPAEQPVETPAPTEAPVPAPEPSLPVPAEQANTAVELVPGALESLIRQALAADPESLRLKVTGLRVTFSGEIEIGPD